MYFFYRNGMFTNAQLSDFHLLLHYLCVTQTLFGDTPAIGILDGLIGSAMNTEGSIVSVVQFHQSFIEYCIRLNLANLLYYYLDFYRYVVWVSNLVDFEIYMSHHITSHHTQKKHVITKESTS